MIDTNSAQVTKEEINDVIKEFEERYKHITPSKPRIFKKSKIILEGLKSLRKEIENGRRFL